MAAAGVATIANFASSKSVVETHAATVFNEAGVYLDTSSCWKSGSNDERFAVYWSTGSETGWNSMNEVATNFYATKLPSKDISLIIFCRMNKNAPDNNWGNKWNQTADITSLNQSKAVFKVNAWDGATGANCWKDNSGYTGKFSAKYVACGDNGWTANDSNYKLTLDMTKAEARLEKKFTVDSGDAAEEFKVTGGTWSESYGCGSVADGTNSTYIDVSAGGTNNIKLLATATYEIYYKYHEMGSGKIWVQISSASEADSFAETFLSSITCTDNSVTFAIGTWNKVGSATTSMEYKYEKLTSGAKHLFEEASVNPSGSNVEKCVARYDRILGKYGYGTASNQYHDFMNRTPASLAGSRVLFAVSNIDNTNRILIVTVISIVAIASVGGYFFLRKRKENN